MHWAALKGHVGAVLFLARAGADVNVKDEFSFTPVTRASQNGHLLAVLGLLQAGADPALCDQEGHNALHWAVYHRQHLVVAWLLQASALCGAIDAADQRGATPLHLAAKKSGREMCRKLLAAGARADLTDADGLVAHEVAAKTGRVSTATFLQRYEALPQRIRRFLVQRGPGNRAHFYIPTANGALALACIFLAYVYYLAVLLPVAWPRNLLAHVLLWTFTPFMYWSYWKSWKADPGQILPQPLELVRAVADRSSFPLTSVAFLPRWSFRLHWPSALISHDSEQGAFIRGHNLGSDGPEVSSGEILSLVRCLRCEVRSRLSVDLQCGGSWEHSILFGLLLHCIGVPYGLGLDHPRAPPS